MELKSGYKQTEVGVIPMDWEVKKLKGVINGVEYGSSSKSKKDGIVPVLRMGNIQNGKIDFSDLVFTDDELEIRKYLLEKDDVLFNRTNTIDLVGKTGIYKSELPAIFAGYLIRIKWNQELLNADYLNYWLNTQTAKNYGHSILSIAVGQANINGTKLKTYPIPLPPTLSEQTAIATALSDTDQYITHLEKLIAKKRNIKQGAMQELLKPKEGWVVKKLGEIAEVKTGPFGTSLHQRDYVDDGTPIITVEHLGERGVIHENLPMVSDYDKKRLDSYSLQTGDIVFSRVGSVDRNSLISEKENGWLFSGRLLRINVDQNKIYAAYLSHYFHLESTKQRIRNAAVGQTMASLNTQILKRIEIDLPRIKVEQSHIATILSEMDSEITTLETKLSKAKSIKQGMMQQLLTGKIRLTI